MNVLVSEWQRIRKSALARNTGWMAVGQGLSLLLQASYFVLLARLLGAVEYGIFVGAFAFTNLVAQYSSLGTGTIFLRYVSRDTGDFSAHWGNILAVTVSLGGGFSLALHLLGPHVLNPQSAALVGLAGIANCVCAQLMIEAGRVFQAFEKVRITATLNLLMNFIRMLTAGGMLLVLHRTTAWNWAVASTAVSLLVATIAVVTVTTHYGRPRFAPSLLYHHGLEGFGYSFAASTSLIYNDLDKTMLSHYGMNVANGIYGMAYRILDVATIPTSALVYAAVPRLFQRGRSGLESVAELSGRLLKRALPVSLLIAIGLFVGAPIIPRILGNSFVESVAALRWLCLIPVFRSLHQLTGSALLGAGLQTHRTATQVVAAGLNFGLNLWLIPRYGWHGAAWASLATDGSLSVMNWGVLRLMLRFGSGGARNEAS
jgi:O-antigen/teichoic acid export membrane protein